jgi:hypothetical protein
MALVLADRVRETTTVVGTGTATLLGAIDSYQSFAAIGNGNTTYYTIVDQSTGAWEVGIGTYTASGTTLSRDTVLSSSNAGALVNFPAGTKDVWGDYPAGRAVTTDTLAYPPAIGSTTPAAGTFTTLTARGDTKIGGDATNPSIRAKPVSGVTRWIEVEGSVSGDPTIATWTSGSSAGMVFTTRGATNFRFTTAASSSNEQLRVSHTASAVNFAQVTGAATGAFPLISAQGSDANIHLGLTSKGNSASFGIRFYTNNGAQEQFRVQHAVSAVNFATVNGSAAGNALQYYAQGNDTNISQVFQSKGTGAINLAPGSSGVNISNGGTVTAITRTASGTAYTSAPIVAISAPTTAGGVQATATCTLGFTNPVITSGGTGYTVNDVLTVTGGTSTTTAQLTVTTVSGGVITGVSILNAGVYSVAPSNPASVTGGTGSSASFTLDWVVRTTFTITNAGSGYVEQPTVTFSGGGGSGAAAYATVGGTSVIKGIGQTGIAAIDFQTAASTTNTVPAMRIRGVSIGTSNTGFLMVQNGNGYAHLLAQGPSGASFTIGANGNGSVLFNTNGTSETNQMRVTHTASAVNYVQVTGAATGGRPVISSQGSDSNVSFDLNAKGVSAIRLQSGNANIMRLNGVASAANFLDVFSSAAAASPRIVAEGTDTNIDLALTPKGTGLVRFGTYTAGAPTATGYINIKAADGTTYKVLVST